MLGEGRATPRRLRHVRGGIPGLATLLFVLPALGLLPATGCSIKKFAINRVAGALTATGELFAADDDPELIRDAAPFALKTIEGLLAEVPENRALLLAACRGFTQYSYAFVQMDAERIDPVDYRAAARMRVRALKLYIRARDYGLRSLELRHPGLGEALKVEPETAVAAVSGEEIELLYWTGASWGAVVSLAKDQPELAADLPAVIALIRRALELDESFDRGAVHETMIVLESLPANMGGSRERARRHFDRAVELSGGRRASPYVIWAESVSVPAQDREEFERMLDLALAVDPDAEPASRLQNLITRDKALRLKNRVEDLFLEPLDSFEGDDS